jgi:uncharacterized membrane protein
VSGLLIWHRVFWHRVFWHRARRGVEPDRYRYRAPTRTRRGFPTNPVATIVLLWLAFGIGHVLLSSRGPRARLIGWLGERGFLGLYSLVALATFVPLVSVYFAHKHQGALLWAPGVVAWGLWLIYGVMGVAFVLLVAGGLTPSPTSMTASADAAGSPPRGIHLITRHAFFMATALFGLAHLVPNGYATDVAFFAGFPLFVLLGSIHQDRRKLSDPASTYRGFFEATPLLPFTGRRTLAGLRDLDWRAVVGGVALALLVRHYHQAWFG